MAENDVMSITGEIRNWRKQVCKSDGTFVIWGHIYDDVMNRFPDGHFIHTGTVVRIVGDLAHTKRSVYRLVGDATGPEVNPWS